MAFSDRDIEGLKKEVERAVLKFLGHKDAAVISTCLKCADRSYDRRKTRDRLSRVMDEHKSNKFADKLMILVDDFKSSLKRGRKRRDEDDDHIVDHKRKRFAEEPDLIMTTAAATAAANAAALNAVVMGQTKLEGNGSTAGYPTPSPGQLTAAKIKEMMANAQRAIAMRKQELGFQQGGGSTDETAQPEPKLAPPVARIDHQDKSKRASELQAQIAARLAATGLPTLMPVPQAAEVIPTSAIDISGKPKEPIKNVIIDDQGRTVDAITGEVIQMTLHTPTLKANLRAKLGQQLKEELQQKKPTVHDLEESNFFDPRVQMKAAARHRRSLNFHEEGKFIKLAQRMRTKAQLERLQDSVAAAAKKTGIASAAKLATIQPKRALDETNVPDVEWWDAYLLSTEELSYSELDRGTPVKDLINRDWITHLVEHPIKMRPPTELDNPPQIPLMLTKKERKKLRRQNRSEAQKEDQEKVRLGLLPPPEPKVRLANLMRVLGTDAVQDPSKVEAFVRAQMDKRKRQHEAANAARKLTKDQAKNKKIKKLKEDTSHGVRVSVYRVRDLSNPSHKFKVETNCNQLFMTGLVALHRDCNVVVVEGGPKQQAKFKRLMLGRIRWREVNKRMAAAAAAESAASSIAADGGSEPKKPSDYCSLVWEGSVKQRAFDKIQFKMCPTELFAREQFRKNDVEQYWDLAYSGAVLEAAGEELM